MTKLFVIVGVRFLLRYNTSSRQNKNNNNTKKGRFSLGLDDRFLILPIKPAENKYTSTNECVDYKSIKIFYTASKMEWNEAKTTSGLQILSSFMAHSNYCASCF